MRTNWRAGSKEGIIHHVKGYLSYSTVWPFSWHLEIYSIAHMWQVLHLSTVFVSINLNVFTPVTLCSEPEQGNWWSHLAFLRLALPPQSEGGGCWDPRGWAKGKSVSFTTQSSPRSRWIWPLWFALLRLHKLNNVNLIFSHFYWTQRKVLPGKSVCNKANWNMIYWMVLLSWLNIIHSSFYPSVQAEHWYDTWILV